MDKDNGFPLDTHILLVDDEPLVLNSLRDFLAFCGSVVSVARNAEEALNLLRKESVDIVITDIRMPGMDGLQLLKQIKEDSPELPVVLITSYGSIENAVEAMKQGAYDYITKPIVDNEIKIIIERFFKQRQLIQENLRLKEELLTAHRERFCNIVGKSAQMQKIYTLIEAISTTRATVLIYGESGTGKRLVAHAIHKSNEFQRDKPFVEVSCGALTETLLESELFGHVKGAFTGAIKDRLGRFELANKGTIFLDEIDAFTPALQVKLLRVLQEGEFERVGDTKTVKVDVRVVAASNQNLYELIAQGKFRKDLFYRLNIIFIEIPPLRQRREDIPLLVNDFIQAHAKQINKKISGISSEAMEILLQYNWPGNVRELENVIERAVILTRGQIITPVDFPENICLQEDKEKTLADNSNLKLKSALMFPEKDFIVTALNSSGWSRNEAAKLLGINRTTLYKKMLKFGLLKNNR